MSKPSSICLMRCAATAPTTQGVATIKPVDLPTNPQVLGVDLYSQHSLSLELAGILLTIALVGAVIIARKNTNPNETLGSGSLPTE